jgi:Uma2 family endonuclease
MTNNEQVMTMIASELVRPRKRQKATYEEYLALAGASQIVEWVNGEVITHMPPNDIHQAFDLFLASVADTFVSVLQLGVVRHAPFEVKLWPSGPSREPDVLFVSTENLSRLTEKRVEGAPDLIIEIISPGSVTIDRVDKFLEYEQAGVSEYWLIDPRRGQRQADFYFLGPNGRFVAAELENGAVFRSAVLPGFWLRLEWLWTRPLPSSQLIAAEILMSVEALPEAVRSAYSALYQALQARAS